MIEPEVYQLFADEFTRADQPFLADLHCGCEPWSRAAAEWIRSSEVVDSIKEYGTSVWIYRDSKDAIVGFASLVATQWQRWPPPDGKRLRLLYIPQLGIAEKYRGFPADRNGGFLIKSWSISFSKPGRWLCRSEKRNHRINMLNC